MRQVITRVTSKGQVTIPVEIRRALGIKPRDRVEFSLADGVATVAKAKSVVEKWAGAFKGTGGPIDIKRLRREFEDSMARNVRREMGLEDEEEDSDQ